MKNIRINQAILLEEFASASARYRVFEMRTPVLVAIDRRVGNLSWDSIMEDLSTELGK